MEQEEKNKKVLKEEVLEMLKSMIKTYHDLPIAALYAPVTGSDLLSVLMLILALHKDD